MTITPTKQPVWNGDPELDPAFENEFYEESPQLRERLDIEESQGPEEGDTPCHATR